MLKNLDYDTLTSEQDYGIVAFARQLLCANRNAVNTSHEAKELTIIGDAAFRSFASSLEQL